MTKIETFTNISRFQLEDEVNCFMEGKTIISVSYSAVWNGLVVHHYCCVAYSCWG